MTDEARPVPPRGSDGRREDAGRWLVGVGRADVTDRRPDLGMAGFAYPRQRTSGELQRDPDGNEMPLYARAFYVAGRARDGAPTGGDGTSGPRHVLIVVVDIWTCTMAIKTEVLGRLNAAARERGEPDRFTDADVLIAGTHTHAAPGGYSDYALYNYSMGGWNQQTFDVIVSGIVAAAQTAIATAAPGRVLVNRGDLLGCGGNRAVAALRNNPEFQPGSDPLTWTDPEMVLLRFIAEADGRDTSVPRDLGVLTWFAIHPTSLGMFNRTISGDNKGWAAMLFERELRREAPGFVAAFANANAGDVSGNVSVDDSGALRVRPPFGGERPPGVATLPRPASPGDFGEDVARMHRLGRQQFEFALGLFRAASTELAGVIDSRAVFVDMADVPLRSEPMSQHPRGHTAPAAFGISFAAGSTEDGIGFASLGALDLDLRLPEGMDVVRARRGRLGLFAAAAAAVALTTTAVAFRRPLIGSAVAALPLAIAAAVPACRGALVAGLARSTVMAELPTPEAGEQDRGSWVMPARRAWPTDFVARQSPKAVMIPAGLARWRPTERIGEAPCPLVPNVVPVQVLRLGGLGIVAVPAEFTSTAGRRLKRTLADALGPAVQQVALTGYANGYAGYVTTPEEYVAQLYEGASTLYGPHTLTAFQQVTRHLAQALRADVPAPTGHPYRQCFAVPVVAGRTG